MGIVESKWEDSALMERVEMPGMCCEQQRKRKKIPIRMHLFFELQKCGEPLNSMYATKGPKLANVPTVDVKIEKLHSKSRVMFRKNRIFARSFEPSATELIGLK